MPQSFELTDKHCDILEPLTSKVRVLTHEQIARTFFTRIKGKDKSIYACQSKTRLLQLPGYPKSSSTKSEMVVRAACPMRFSGQIIPLS